MKLTESARDAFLSLPQPVSIQDKAKYLNKLLHVGFDLLDVGSFEINNDIADLLAQLDLANSSTQLLVFVANVQNATKAADLEQVSHLGYWIKGTSELTAETTLWQELASIQAICAQCHKKLIVYLCIDFEQAQNVENFVDNIAQIGIDSIVLEDITGSSSTDTIKAIFEPLIARFPQTMFGAHLHAKPSQVAKKVKAARKVGVQSLDCAVRGFGLCLPANDKKTGNLATELVVSELRQLGVNLTLNDTKLAEAMLQSQYVFG